LRDVALGQLAADPSLDLVIYGHSHVAALERSSGNGVYANSGSWMSKATYLRVDEQRIALMDWTGSAEGEVLNTLDRGSEKALAET
jgi:UDP-2,3-diacylglucosamine pyrophosphatase LpxH